MKIKTEYNPGDKVKDKVTGFKGIVMAVTYYSTGCLHYGLMSTKLINNKLGEWEWFDQSRLEIVKEDVVSFDIIDGTTSGPAPNAPQQ